MQGMAACKHPQGREEEKEEEEDEEGGGSTLEADAFLPLKINIENTSLCLFLFE